MKNLKQSQSAAWQLMALFAMMAGLILSSPLRAEEKADDKANVKQLTFTTPDEAVKALVDAAKAADHETLHKIFGPEGRELGTGDKVQDAAAFAQFAKAIGQMCNQQHESDDKIILDIGADNWPFPIPLVKKDGKWFFDTAAGKEEIINRHIGEDELNAIAVCRKYVDAQRHYASKDRDGSEVLKYAQHFKSTAGTKDGLYWDATPNEEQSPFGALVAEAHAAGYGGHKSGEGPHPFHGYVFRVITAQGPKAPGGKYNYVINGNMIGGFAMIAYPFKWGESGIMTFIVNQQGKVYQRNLGPKTSDLAAAIKEYDPDSKWTVVEDQGQVTQ